MGLGEFISKVTKQDRFRLNKRAQNHPETRDKHEYLSNEQFVLELADFCSHHSDWNSKQKIQAKITFRPAVGLPRLSGSGFEAHDIDKILTKSKTGFLQLGKANAIGFANEGAVDLLKAQSSSNATTKYTDLMLIFRPGTQQMIAEQLPAEMLTSLKGIGLVVDQHRPGEHVAVCLYDSHLKSINQQIQSLKKSFKDDDRSRIIVSFDEFNEKLSPIGVAADWHEEPKLAVSNDHLTDIIGALASWDLMDFTLLKKILEMTRRLSPELATRVIEAACQRSKILSKYDPSSKITQHGLIPLEAFIKSAKAIPAQAFDELLRHNNNPFFFALAERSARSSKGRPLPLSPETQSILAREGQLQKDTEAQLAEILAALPPEQLSSPEVWIPIARAHLESLKEHGHISHETHAQCMRSLQTLNEKMLRPEVQKKLHEHFHQEPLDSLVHRVVSTELNLTREEVQLFLALGKGRADIAQELLGQTMSNQQVLKTAHWLRDAITNSRNDPNQEVYLDLRFLTDQIGGIPHYHHTAGTELANAQEYLLPGHGYSNRRTSIEQRAKAIEAIADSVVPSLSNKLQILLFMYRELLAHQRMPSLFQVYQEIVRLHSK